jgi:hypothetical protein
MNDDGKEYLAQIQRRIERLGGEESPEEFNRKIGEEQVEYTLDDELD